jgi:hypothetical protein
MESNNSCPPWTEQLMPQQILTVIFPWFSFSDMYLPHITLIINNYPSDIYLFTEMKGKNHNFRRNRIFFGEEFFARTERRLDRILGKKQASS